MLSDDPTRTRLERLRCTTALALALPGLAVRLRDGSDVAIEALRAPLPERPHETVPLCWMRSLAAEAHRRHGAGEALPDWVTGGDVTIELGLGRGRTLLPFDVVRAECPTVWTHAIAVPGRVEQIRDATAEVAATESVPDGVGDEVRLHGAPDLDVAVVTVTCRPSEDLSAEAAHLLRAVSMRTVVNGVHGPHDVHGATP